MPKWVNLLDKKENVVENPRLNVLLEIYQLNSFLCTKLADNIGHISIEEINRISKPKCPIIV